MGKTHLESIQPKNIKKEKNTSITWIRVIRNEIAVAVCKMKHQKLHNGFKLAKRNIRKERRKKNNKRAIKKVCFICQPSIKMIYKFGC